MTVITHLARSSLYFWVTHTFPKSNRQTKLERATEYARPRRASLALSMGYREEHRRGREVCEEIQHHLMMNISTGNEAICGNRGRPPVRTSLLSTSWPNVT